MPEDLSAALPSIRPMIEAFNIPVLECDGYEADDIIGTLVKEAEKHDFTTYMVTPDKDFGQLVSEKNFLYKPSRMGDGIEIMGPKEILARWGIQRTDQVVDILGLMGRHLGQYSWRARRRRKDRQQTHLRNSARRKSARAGPELKGKIKETIESHRESPCSRKAWPRFIAIRPSALDIEALRLRDRNDEAVKELWSSSSSTRSANDCSAMISRRGADSAEARNPRPEKSGDPGESRPQRKRKKREPADLDFSAKHLLRRSRALNSSISGRPQIQNDLHCRGTHETSRNAHEEPALRHLAIECSHPDPKQACLTGLAFSIEPHKARFLELPDGNREKRESSTNSRR